MASIETRPYRTASVSSVNWDVSVVSPSLGQSELPEVWQVGEDIVFSISVALRPTFWVETGLSSDTPLTVVAIATCAVARKKWQVRETLDFHHLSREVFLSLCVPGQEIAQEISLDLWVVGDAPVNESQIHHGAKLWESASPRIYPLEDGSQAFPTSAISFRETNRPAVPWLVEIDPESTPEWKVSGCLRLYVNTDFPLAEEILENTASADVYTQITHDIYFMAIQKLTQWRGPGGYSEANLDSLALEDHECLAALGKDAAHKIALSLGGALALAQENPYALLVRIRESFPFYERSL